MILSISGRQEPIFAVEPLLKRSSNHAAFLTSTLKRRRRSPFHLCLLDSNGLQRGSEQWKNEQSFCQPTMGDGVASFSSEDEGPGIEGFQIIGEAKPGCKLLGCGYPVGYGMDGEVCGMGCGMMVSEGEGDVAWEVEDEATAVLMMEGGIAKG
ncbi:unnamed protein product [Fraxinus pennsylvanica]|uniref:Uncharacterized protein n=1 Tax=Fraxinus pennsylvanica TaxID=56036 RepID=A0AAD1ZC05_9LAMI|nr:unnamed protein product [Fraxinus pennsylvanica]